MSIQIYTRYCKIHKIKIIADMKWFVKYRLQRQLLHLFQTSEQELQALHYEEYERIILKIKWICKLHGVSLL